MYKLDLFTLLSCFIISNTQVEITSTVYQSVLVRLRKLN